MAYNLQPLINTLEQILNPQQTLWIVDDNKPQLQSLLKKSTSLLQILDKSFLTKIESLESQIRDAAHKAEDIIESHMVDQILSNPEGVSFAFITPDLQQVMQELDSVTEQVVKLIQEKMKSTESSSSGASFSRNVDSVKSKALVGVDEDLRQLMDRLMGVQRELEIVPIVGMGGIGKTTLARKLYEDPAIVEHFTSLAWVTISQDYNMYTILLSLLHCITGSVSNEDIGGLKDELYQSLYDRRYIIVLDDIWNINFWDEIRMYFPDNNNGSRILITSRESEVAKHANSDSVHHQMQLLSESTSWDLLRQIVFGEEAACPDFLQGIGENIASDCGGLPLAIVVIGGLLSKEERSKDVWESIANNVASAIVEADEQFLNILSLSYSHLPNQLKPCFLYLGFFEDSDGIPADLLIQMWLGDGFVISMEVAEDCLKALVERNLVMVERCEDGKPESYKVHDLLRDLCIMKSYEEKFLCFVKSGLEETFSNPRRVCVDRLEDYSALAESVSLIRSFICYNEDDYDGGIKSSAVFQSRLLKMCMLPVDFEEFPTELLELVNLRLLFVGCCSRIPNGISRLKNLQTLVADVESGVLTSEIFEMPELRHLRLNEDIEIDIEEGKEKMVPNKLQTISRIKITHSLIGRGFLESIPDIQELEIVCDFEDLMPTAVDLTHLHKLKTLRIRFDLEDEEARRILPTFKFPRGLRELV